MDISSRNGMTLSSGPNSTSEDKMRVSLWTTSLHTLSEHCGYGDMRDQLSEPVVVLELFSVETLTAVYFCNVTLQRQGFLRVLFVLELKVAASSLRKNYIVSSSK
jgi:hypothetical protein